MKSNENAVVYTTESTAAELNKVRGFDPMKYARTTESGAVLDLPYQKLWFRLRHPNGKIRLFIRNISDKVSAIEARVYFDRRDSEPASNHIISGVDISDKQAVAQAQLSAMGNALTDAGFGLQFLSAVPTAPSVITEPSKKVVKMQKQETTPKVAPKNEEAAVQPESKKEEIKNDITVDAPVVESKTESVKADAPPAVIEATENTPETPKADPLLSIVNSLEGNGVTIDTNTGEVVEEAAKSENAAEENNAEVNTEVAQTAEVPAPEVKTVSYDKTTPIEEICAVMTLDDAMNYVIEGGPYNGWKMSTLAERRPVKVLEMIMEKYPVKDNILRAATKIILDSKK